MSLRTKFSVVLALLGLALAINVALSVWSIRFLERELAGPLRSAQPVLAGLHQVKRLGEQEADELGIGRSFLPAPSQTGPRPPSPALIGPRVIESEHAVIRELEAMRTLGSLLLRSGVSTTQNLRDRSQEIMDLASRWEGDGTAELYQQLVRQIEARHELIERIEGRIIDDARLATDYGERIRVVILIIIAVSVLFAGFIVAFAVVLIRRWVLDPVGRLRAGARQLGAGDFDHRIRIESDDELGQLGGEFNHMAALIKAMQDERVERERLAAMGEMAQRTVHNLRTPLAGIRGLAETTLEELDAGSELREMQTRIITTVDRFEGWLQSMLRVSSPLELHHTSYAPARLVESVIESHQSVASAKTVTITLDDHGAPQQATGDPAQLEHALTALLSNAIDFSPMGSVVRLELGQESGFWTLRVEDQGPGIPPDLHVAVFRPYFTTRKSGTGIGLAMVKRIIEQHRGSVGLKSPVNPGSVSGTAFFLTIRIDARDDNPTGVANDGH